jgi:hypothetical protein
MSWESRRNHAGWGARRNSISGIVERPKRSFSPQGRSASTTDIQTLGPLARQTLAIGTTEALRRFWQYAACQPRQTPASRRSLPGPALPDVVGREPQNPLMRDDWLSNRIVKY